MNFHGIYSSKLSQLVKVCLTNKQRLCEFGTSASTCRSCRRSKLLKAKVIGLPMSFNRSLVNLSTDENARVTVDDVMCAKNIQRCKSQLRSQAPFDLKRDTRFLGRDLNKLKPAAVLVPLCLINGQPSLLFTVRSMRLSSHRGDVSFPGGMVDETDEGVINTALREAEEEIGIHKEMVDVIGLLRPMPSVNYSSLVTPVVGYCGDVDIANLKISPDEVNEVFSETIDLLCNKNSMHYTTFKSIVIYRVPVFIGRKHKIWGLTATFVEQTLRLLAPELYNSSHCTYSFQIEKNRG